MPETEIRSSLKFGTSGLRGLVADLVGPPARLWTAAFLNYMAEREPGANTVFVGRDLRPSSPEISQECLAAALALGWEAVDCGVLPTPALAAYAMKHTAPALMISGSHIPADQNGLKFYRRTGEIDKKDEAAIAAIKATGPTLPRALVAAHRSDATGEAQAEYLARFSNLLPAGAFSRLRIGLYQHSSVARDLLGRILAGYGAEVVALGRSNVFVPIDTESLSNESRRQLSAWVGEHKLDVLVSTDGDADRPLVIDDRGEQVRGDLLGLLTSLYLKAGTVVTPVTSNTGISDARGFEVVRTRVGSPFVIAGMYSGADRREPVVGFEANGGYLTASPVRLNGATLDPLPTRDSVLPILLTLATIAGQGKALSTITAELALPVAVSDRLEHYPFARSAAFMAWLRAERRNVESVTDGLGSIQRIIDIDGLQIFFTDGAMVHFRPSGNAPEMRCYAEAPEQARAERLLASGLELAGAFCA